MTHSAQKKHIAIIFVIIFLLSLFAYSRTFNGEFQFDDDISIVENPYVNGTSKYSLHNFLSGVANGGRPFTAITFALNYRLGGLDVRWYHVTNFLIHIFNGILVFYLALFTFNSPKLTDSYHSRAPYAALIAAALFLLHPIQTEAVSYISQRYESLVSLFYLCSLLAYIKARLAGQQRAESRGPRAESNELYATRYTLSATRYSLHATPYTLYAISIISGILAIYSKEIAITLPIVIILYDFYFLEDKPFLKRIAGPGIFMGLALIAGILIISGFGNSIDAGFSVRAFAPWEYLLTQFRVIATYVRLLFLPINQNLDYDFRISKTIFEADTFLAFVFLTALLTFALIFLKKWKLGSFFILWFFIVLLPTSSLVPIIDVIFEHRVYLASLGFFMIVSDLLSGWMMSHKERYNRTAVFAVILIVILLTAATFQRNKVWETKLSLWTDAAQKSPMKSRVHNNLGNCYMLLGKHFLAIEEYKKAIALNQNNIESYYNLAVNLENVGMLNHAIYYYDIFCKIAPASYSRQKEEARKRVDSFYSKKVK